MGRSDICTGMNVSPAVIEKFWNNVDQTPTCWNWIGTLDDHGIPVIRCGTKKFGTLEKHSARRVALVLAGKTLLETKHALPGVCRNQLCVNPDHLAMGDEARFWSKVQKLSGEDACWVWTARLDKDSYGQFRICQDGKKFAIKAHTYSWELANSFTLKKGIGHCVCHTCDHPYCVNPAHLFLGTQQENTQDRNNKGRQARGETSGAAKLTESQVIEMRQSRAEGMTLTQLAKLFGVAATTAGYVVNRRSWKHVA